MRPSPGDMVQIVLDAWESLPDFLLVATKGSIARAMSYNEYCDHFKNESGGLADPQHVLQWMSHGEQFPFIFVRVVPPSPEIQRRFHVNDCQIGKIVVLGSRFFQIIDKTNIEGE